MTVAMLGLFMAVLDCVIVSIALPSITSYYQADIALSQWTITAYLVAVTSTMLIFARLSDKWGKNRIFLAGAVLFIAGSLGCALAPTILALISLRIVQGLGAAMLSSLVMAIVFDIYPFSEHGRAMGIVGGIVALASLSGPIIGGFLVEFVGWQSIFLINLPVGVVMTVLGFASMDLERPKTTGPFVMDWTGAGSLVAVIISFMLVLAHLAEGDSDIVSLAVGTAICIAALGLFVRTEKRSPHPIFDLLIFSERNFVAPLLSMTLFFSAVMILYVSLPIYLEGVLSLSPSQVGGVFMLMAGILTVGSPLVGRMYDRVVWKHYTTLGLLIAAFGFVFLAISAQAMDMPLILGALVVFTVGFTLFQSPVNTEIMRGLPLEKSATSSGLNNTGRYFGMAVGAVLASLVYAFQLHSEGYTGVITAAGDALIASATAGTLTAAGVLCITGMILQTIIRRECQVSIMASGSTSATPSGKHHTLFSPSRASFLDTKFRSILYNPDKLAGQYIRPGDRVLDFGCGPGFFTRAFAKRVGATGSVIAADLQEEMLDILKGKLGPEGLLPQIKTHRCKPYSLDLSPDRDGKVDVAFGIFAIHEVPDRAKLFSGISAMLAPGGTFFYTEPLSRSQSGNLRMALPLQKGPG
jgi:EmrB/QacA subfamily drug resistance transporter